MTDFGGEKCADTSVDDSGFHDDSLDCDGDSELNLVDEEWLMEDNDDMELDEGELASLEGDLHELFDVKDPPIDRDSSSLREPCSGKRSRAPSSSGKLITPFPKFFTIKLACCNSGRIIVMCF